MREEIISELRTTEPAAFVSSHIFDRTPHVFGDDKSRHMVWRGQLASSLGVDPVEVTIVGSAAVGVSLSPHKNFKIFDQDSDIDVAIVSPFHFQTAWRFFRRNSSLRAKLSGVERNAWDEHRTRLIYWGTIATDKLLSRLPFGLEWRSALDKLESVIENDHAINIRIYNDYDSLRQYQIQSVRLRRDDLLSEKG